MADIVTSRRAEDDFHRIWLHIALEDENAADRLLSAIGDKIERLRIFPEIGRRRDEIRPGARGLVHGAYLILFEYDPASDTVIIVTVVEGMRDLDRLF